MKIYKLNIKALIFLLIAGVMTFMACEDEKVYPRTRLFQPVLNEDLEAVNNTIIVDLGVMKEALSYTVEVSRDSFATVLYTFQTDQSYFVINEETIGEELLWFTIYQVKVTAHADEAQYNSLPSDLGSVRTEKYPSNMTTPTFFDILDTRARVTWTPSGAPITGIKVFAGNDERLTTPLAEYTLTPEEQAASEKIISGLTAETAYQIAIYSDATLRGWEIYSTREAFISGDNVLDLSSVDTGDVNLANVLPDLADGSIVVLGGGKTYLAGGYAFEKSISFVAGYSFTPALPVIDCSTNFNMLEGASVGYVTFKDIKLTAPDGFGGRYVFNIDKSSTIGEIKFESCIIRTLRGICRMKGGEGVLDKYTLSDCQVDSINGYAVISIDKNTWMCNNILLENSTISKCQYFLVSRNNSNSVVIDGCTINEAPEKGRQMFRWRESGQDEVTNGISIINTIWGHGWNMTVGETDYGVDGFDGLANTNWNVVNTYTTGDFVYGANKDEIPGFPSFNYTGTIYDLWNDPDNADFSFKDTGFAGKGNSGDPRWRIGL